MVSPAATTTYTATAAIDAKNSIQQTATVTVTSPIAGKIKHIFFMLQENRSFDNYFGQLGAYRAPSSADRLASLIRKPLTVLIPASCLRITIPT